MRRAGIVSLVLVSVLGMVMGMLRGPLAVTEDVLWPLSWVAWPLVGGVILIRRPANRIGIACMLIGVVWGLAFALQSFVLDLPDGAAAWIELFYTVLGIVPWLIIVWLLANFPTGLPAGRLERIPVFIRPMARQAIERFAQERGYGTVTDEVMDQARDFMGM